MHIGRAGYGLIIQTVTCHVFLKNLEKNRKYRLVVKFVVFILKINKSTTVTVKRAKIKTK